jgi:hypothetical protein
MVEAVKVPPVKGNPFRNPILRKQYDGMFYVFSIKHRDLFRPDGTPHRGNSWATNFWRGYEGKDDPKRWDRASRQTPAWACWCAGRDVRKLETSK